MKYIVFFFLLQFAAVSQAQSFYDLSAKTIDGDVLDFADLQGKLVMIVNTASKCGLTPQYEALETLFKTYGGDDFVILGFPSNDFLKQEPGTEKEIKSFCQANYGVTFTMMSKVVVKGNDKHPVYQWLTDKNLNKVQDSEVKWNFQKYLIDKKGNLLEVFSPRTDPLSTEITELIK